MLYVNLSEQNANPTPSSAAMDDGWMLAVPVSGFRGTVDFLGITDW